MEWRFAGLQSRWARRALAIAGFGFPAADDAGQLGNWRPVWTVATGLAGATDEERRDCKDPWVTDEENGAAVEAVNDVGGGKSNYARVGREEKARGGCSFAAVAASRPSSSAVGDLEPLYAVDRPFFHVDLLDAVEAAVRDAMKKDEGLLL